MSILKKNKDHSHLMEDSRYHRIKSLFAAIVCMQIALGGFMVYCNITNNNSAELKDTPIVIENEDSTDLYIVNQNPKISYVDNMELKIESDNDNIKPYLVDTRWEIVGSDISGKGDTINITGAEKQGKSFVVKVEVDLGYKIVQHYKVVSTTPVHYDFPQDLGFYYA